MEPERESRRQRLLWAGIIFVAGLIIAGIFVAIAGGSYDSDEFVYLLLATGVAHGHMPYRDFLFFHPPGIVYLMGWLNPVIKHSWWLGRVPSIVLDAATCSLTYLVARRFLSRRVAITAGLLCAASPVMLITGTRVMPDVYVAFFSFLAIYLLLVGESWRWAVLAGMTFAVAIIFKYPAILTLPACFLLAGKRRSVPFAIALAVTLALLLLPFMPYWHQFYSDTVAFQSGRSRELIGTRGLSILLFLILLQPLALFGAFVRPVRWWLIAGYASAFLYLLTPQVYYHYMVPQVPFGAILGAVYLASLAKVRKRVLVPMVAAACVIVTIIWGSIVNFTPGQNALHMTAYQVSNVVPVARWVQKYTKPSGSILDDHAEVPVIADRYNCMTYFWNDAKILTQPQVEQCLTSIRYIVHSFGNGDGFPPYSLYQWETRYCRRTVGSTRNGAFVFDDHCIAPYLPNRQ